MSVNMLHGQQKTAERHTQAMSDKEVRATQYMAHKQLIQKDSGERRFYLHSTLQTRELSGTVETQSFAQPQRSPIAESVGRSAELLPDGLRLHRPCAKSQYVEDYDSLCMTSVQFLLDEVNRQ